MSVDEQDVARRLMGAWDRAEQLSPITASAPEFDVAAAYRVLAHIHRMRMEQGWVPVGRKIGFTNCTIWPRYGVFQPMWARIWAHTVYDAPAGAATLSLRGLMQPRIEPEIVFGLGSRLAATEDPREALGAASWIAAGFEIVQSHFPDWRFQAADCTAAFGLHARLVVGRRVRIDPALRERLADLLPRFALELRNGDTVVDRGIGSNVLGGPAHALAYLARVLATQPHAPPLAAGEIVTTGTISDAWPVAAGQTWHSDYGELPVRGLALAFT